MNNPRYYFGNYIKIHQLSDFFDHVRIMLLEHFDKPHMQNTLFLVGTVSVFSVKHIRENNPGYKIIVYQLEQMMGGDNWNSVELLIKNMEGYDEIWDYDDLNVLYLSQKGITVNKVVPMLYTHNLDVATNKKNPSIDILFYGYLNERRAKIMKYIQSEVFHHLKIVWIFGTIDLIDYIEDSKVILNLHAYEPWNRQEQVRIFYSLINGKTVVSEPSQINYYGDGIVEAKPQDMPRVLKEVCYNGTWRTIGANGKQKFLDKTLKYLEQNN